MNEHTITEQRADSTNITYICSRSVCENAHAGPFLHRDGSRHFPAPDEDVKHFTLKQF